MFTEYTVIELLKFCTTKYLPLTSDEIAQWKEDSLEHFISQKEQSNTIKGNYLRNRAMRLIAAIDLRFSAYFQTFCQQTMQELISYDNASGDLSKQV